MNEDILREATKKDGKKVWKEIHHSVNQICFWGDESMIDFNFFLLPPQVCPLFFLVKRTLFCSGTPSSTRGHVSLNHSWLSRVSICDWFRDKYVMSFTAGEL